MRRPALILSVFFGAGIYAVFLFNLPLVVWVIAFGCFIAMMLVVDQKKGIVLVLLFSFFAGGFAYISADYKIDIQTQLTGQDVKIQGEVLSVTQDKEHATLQVGTDAYGTILVSIYQRKPDFNDAVGKWIGVCGMLERPPTSGNPGGFDYRRYLKSVGVFSVMQVQPDQVELSNKAVNRFSHAIAGFRHRFEEKLSKEIGKKQTGLTIAMLFGDKSGMEEEVYESFQRNGTAHILSVSGLHVGFLYGILVILLGGKRRPIPNIIILSILVFYGILSGFCPSVTRALLMIGLHMLSKVLCRQYDLLSSAGLAAIFLMVQNPFSIFHPGFQLSFLAVILMGWIFPILSRTLQKGHILSMLLPMPALQVTMAPFTAYIFNYFSFGAYLANFGVVFFSGILIPAGLITMISSELPGPIFQMMATFVDICIRCIMWCNNLTYAGGKTCIDVVSPTVFWLVVVYGVFFFLLSETGRILWLRKKYKAITCVLFIVIVSASLLNWITEDGFEKADAVFVDVGQGDCLHIRTPSGKNILIDGGGKESFDIGKRVLKPYLLKNGVGKVDLAISTHLDIDHYGGIRSLAAEGMVNSLGLYAGNQLIEPVILSETSLSKDQIIYLHKGDRIDVDPYVWLEFLYPDQKSEQIYESELLVKEENPRSLVVRVHLGDYKILMTGDIDKKTEAEVLALSENKKIEVDILKIGHHGSKNSTSDEFMLAVNPQIAVFQTGKNNYGHPDIRILEKCRKKGIMIYRTDKNGAIGLFGLYKDQNPFVRTFKKGI